MLSFWPSFSLLVFFLVILLECRAIAGRVTLPLGGFLMLFCYGAIGAPLLALLLQQIVTPLEASTESMHLMAWLIAPPIEEAAKALPVIVLAFLTREARRLSIADLTLIGFASGAGFGFVEGNLNALVNGTLPGFASLAALGLQTGNGGVFFAGHAVTTALVGLAAGLGLRFLPLKIAYAWALSAFAILWASFDHGIYNWKLLNADGTGTPPNAHFAVELLHIAALKGQLATWLLPLGLIVAQFFEAHLCSKAVGARRDLLLAREWRPWVVNEWLVALLRAPLGRAAFGQTLGYFRLRRAFYLAAFEARRDPGDPTWTRHAHALEERLKRERSILFDPPPGTWLLPLPVLQTYAAEWTWRMRWVLAFTVLFVFLFLLGPRSLPDGLRQFLYGQTFTIAMVAAGLAFAIWRIILFVRQPRPDPLAAEGAAYAGYYTRALLLGCSFVCGLFPAAALLLGWKAFAPGAAFLSGYLPGWIAQGGNLQTLLGLGAVGSAVAPDPRPTGEAYRHEIAAADERLRLLAADIEETTGATETASPGGERPLRLEAFLDAMAKLDAERDAQARRQLVLDECERHAGEATIADPAPAAQAVKDEFDRLAGELLDAAAKELDAIAAVEQAYGRVWAEIMQDLDAHDVLRRRLSGPLRAAWQAQDDTGWALRVVEASDEGLLPMQLTLLHELQAVAANAQSTRADLVAAGIERIREAAARYGEDDPFAFAATEQANDDEAALLAEFASSEPPAEAPKPFGLRTPPQPVEPPAAPADEGAKVEPLQPAPSPVQEALDQLIDSGRSDERYLETIRHLERSAEALRHPLGPVETETRSIASVADEPAEASERAEPQGELEALIDAIKRDSGYLDFTKAARSAQSDEERVPPDRDDTAAEAHDAPAVAEERDAFDIEMPTEDESDATGEPVAASASVEPADERVERAQTISAAAPEPIVASHHDAPAIDLGQTADDALALEIEEAVPVDEPKAEAAPETAERREPEDTSSASPESTAAPSDEPAVTQTLDETPAPEATIPTEPVLVARLPEPIEERAEPDEAVAAPTPEPAIAGSESAQHEAEGEPFALVAEDEPAVDVKEIQPPAPVALEQSDQLALPLLPDQPVEKPAPVEPDRPAIEPARLREPDRPSSRAEIRSSLFTRLFQSSKRQASDSAAKQTRWDEPKPLDTKPAQSAVTPSIGDQPSALQPPAPSADIRTPKTDWLADFTAPKPEPVDARTDDTLLERIEWPTLSRAVDADDSTRGAEAEQTASVETPAADDHAQARDAVQADIEQAEVVAPAVDTEPVDTEPLESKAPADDVAVSSASDEADAVAATVTVDTIKSVEPEAPAHDAADSSLAEQPESTASDAPEAAKVEVEKAQGGGDEFASKADRLSYLLAKLEQAVQAKVAASSTPGEAPVAAAPIAPSAPTETSEAPIAVEPKIEEPQQPLEPTPQANQADESPTPQAEVSIAAAQATPAAMAPLPAMATPEPRNATEPHPGADRLSYLLNKLFETAERQPVERPAVPQPADPEPLPASDVLSPVEAPAYPQESEILDLRGPHPLPEPPDEAEPGTAASLPPAESKTEEPVRAAATPIEAPAVVEPLQSAPIDTAQDETTKPAPSQSELQPLAKTPDVTPAPASTQPSDQPATSSPRPRPAGPATHFGSRSKPPRPKSPARTRDAQPPTASAPETDLPSIAPQRPPAPATGVPAADGETPATTPKRDWKLARSEPSKPVDAPPADSAKKPDIRVKTGSGALATTDAAPVTSPAATAQTPGKYYGPRLAKADDDASANTPAQQRALGLADALTEYYAKTGEPQPPMHTTDRATLQRIMTNGKLEAPRRRGAAWSMSGMARRGEVAIRLKPGAEQFVEFVPSNEIFGQVAHYYPRGVGKGSFATHIPAGHLEYFDVTAHQWVPLLRGRE